MSWPHGPRKTVHCTRTVIADLSNTARKIHHRICRNLELVRFSEPPPAAVVSFLHVIRGF